MADHTVKIRIAGQEIKETMRAIRALRVSVTDFSDAVDRLNQNLSKNVTKIRELLKDVPKVRYANSGGGGNGRGSGSGKVAAPPGAKQFVGPPTLDDYLAKNKPPIVAPPINHMAKAWQDAKANIARGNVSGAGGNLAGALGKSNGFIGSLVRASTTLTALGAAAGLILAPFAAIGYAVVKFIQAISDMIVAIHNAIIKLKDFNLTTGKSSSEQGRVEALAANLGLDKQKVANDSVKFGNPAAFWAMIEAIRNADPKAAKLTANSMGMGDYAGVNKGSMSEDTYQRMKGAQKAQNPIGDAIVGKLGEEISGLIADFNALRELLVKGIIAALAPLIMQLRMLFSGLRFLTDMAQAFANWLSGFIPGMNSAADKLKKAAEKQMEAADKQLRAAGSYGPGERAARALRGVGDFRNGDHEALKTQLKKLGAI